MKSTLNPSDPTKRYNISVNKILEDYETTSPNSNTKYQIPSLRNFRTRQKSVSYIKTPSDKLCKQVDIGLSDLFHFLLPRFMTKSLERKNS